MNKKEFMQKLKQLLPEADKRDILLDYEEHFLSGINDGKTEEEIVAELGSPEEVAREYGYTEKDPVKGNVWLGVGLILFDLFVGISLLGSLLGVWVALWAVPVALFTASIALIIGSFVSLVFITLPWYIMLTAGIALLALSVLLGIGMVYVTKGCYLALKWYVKLHISAFRGK